MDITRSSPSPRAWSYPTRWPYIFWRPSLLHMQRKNVHSLQAIYFSPSLRAPYLLHLHWPSGNSRKCNIRADANNGTHSFSKGNIMVSCYAFSSHICGLVRVSGVYQLPIQNQPIWPPKKGSMFLIYICLIRTLSVVRHFGNEVFHGKVLD